jgi:hypothetical protein
VSWIPVEALSQKEPRAAYDYWLRKRGDRAMPQPRDIDPTEIGPLLPAVTLVGVLDETPPDYFFRIAGELLKLATGFQCMGHRLSELKDRHGVWYERCVERFDAVCAEKAPKANTSILTGLGRSFYTLEIVWLPLSQDGNRVDRIFSCIGLVQCPEKVVAHITGTARPSGKRGDT